MPIYEYRCTACNERFSRHESIEDHARPQEHRPDAQLLGAARLLLPILAKPGEEVAARRSGLGHLVVAAVAVVADRARADEDARSPRRRAHRLDQRAGRLQAAVAHFLLVFFAPALAADVRSRQVDDPVHAFERARPLAARPGVPADLAGMARVAHERDHLVASRPQGAHQIRPDETVRSRDCDFHPAMIPRERASGDRDPCYAPPP